MPAMARHLRRPLIALVAVFAASFGAIDATACSMMEQSQRACRPACGCCPSEVDQGPATGIGMGTLAAMSQAPGLGYSAPTEACSCSSQEPVSPKPKPTRRTAEGRPELSKVAAFVRLDEVFVPRVTLVRQVLANQSLAKAPLYLRNERLLF
jgi:hypothetical protein